MLSILTQDISITNQRITVVPKYVSISYIIGFCWQGDKNMIKIMMKMIIIMIMTMIRMMMMRWIGGLPMSGCGELSPNTGINPHFTLLGLDDDYDYDDQDDDDDGFADDDDGCYWVPIQGLTLISLCWNMVIQMMMMMMMMMMIVVMLAVTEPQLP